MAIRRGVPLDEVAGANCEAVGVGNEQLPMGLAQALMTPDPAGHDDSPFTGGAEFLEASLIGAAVSVEKQADAHSPFDCAGKHPAVTWARLIDRDIEPGRRGPDESVQQSARCVRPQRAGESAHDVPSERALTSMRGPQ
jgi:hypothetical protein